MKTESKTSAIVIALLQGRTIDQWNHGKEFRTTRLGGLIFAIRKAELKIESREIKTEGQGKPPVEYFCTKQSIDKFLSDEKNSKYLVSINFKQISENQFAVR